MYHLIVVVCVWSIFAYIFIDFKRVKEYYPTLLYYMVLNLSYNFLYYNKTLWFYKTKTETILNHTIISIVFILGIVPISILIYLQIFPENKGYKSKISYILVWATFFALIEYLFLTNDMFVYYNSWTMAKSFIFDVVMFSMFYVHYKKPFWAVILTGIIVFIFIILFPVPLSSMK